MANTTNKIGALIPSKAPNLLIAPTDYSQAYQDQINNALRLYFNQIDSFTQAVSIPDVGATTQRPTQNLLSGQIFFDSTLGIPIWWTGTKWVNASGTAV
jgi:hypothetical protein